ncbi:MAG: hypothetical protein KatS3mg076_1175 [Candidatus Binatia bacterium]|nr:MAG: hypothetical protein KatS3mg076_1175 [Candidatus Binatia bacterium]
MNGVGKALILFGLALVVLGVLLTLVGKIPWIGRLPGDIYVRREHFTFYFPLTTCLLLSALLTLLLYLFRR